MSRTTAKPEAMGYTNEKGEQIDPPRVTMNRDVWLQETASLLTQASMEMVQAMAQRPNDSGPFLRVFSLITHLAVDTQKLLQQQGEPPKQPPVANGGGTSDNGPMEARVTKLEDFAQDTRERLTRIEARLDTFPAVFATKEDLHKELHSMTWRIFGACAGLVAAVYFIAKYVSG